MSKCAIKDCPNPAVAHGLCAKHYMRQRRRGDPEADRLKPGPKPQAKPEEPETASRLTLDEMRRLDASDRRAQRIIADVDTYNLFRRCLHPDSRNSVSPEMLHDAWLAFRNLEAVTYDKKKLPPPLPRDLNELLARRYNAMTKKQKP